MADGHDVLQQASLTTRRAWDEHASGGEPATLRDEVAHSWRRSVLHVRRDLNEAPVVDEGFVADRWRASRLRHAVSAISDDLTRLVSDGDLIAAVAGVDGTILWTQGSGWMRDRAAAVHFAPGGRWDEASMGTNALGLVLQTNRPARVFSGEHWSAAVHEWVCYSAPIRDPADGRLLGVIDLSTTWDRAQTTGLSTTSLLARSLSLILPAELGHADGAGLFLKTLGARPHVSMDGRSVSLPPRQVEILTVLSLRPDGMSLEQLHSALFDDLRVKPATVKAEVSHLRRALGNVVASRPYRLAVPVVADHLEVELAIRAGRLDRAVEAYSGPLLPNSDAPLLRDHRHFLEVAIRRAVLTSGDPELLFALGGTLTWDLELHERTLAVLPDQDPRAAITHARADSARR